jgi:hypothetical protein
MGCRWARGRAPSSRGDGLLASLSHLSQILSDQRWGRPRSALRASGEFPVKGGGGRTVSGDPLAFVLAATGRSDPAVLSLDESVNMYRT